MLVQRASMQNSMKRWRGGRNMHARNDEGMPSNPQNGSQVIAICGQLPTQTPSKRQDFRPWSQVEEEEAESYIHSEVWKTPFGSW
jgi:hypothetical protein